VLLQECDKERDAGASTFALMPAGGLVFPGMREQLAPLAPDGLVDAADSDFTLPPPPPLSERTLASWRFRFPQLQLESGLPFLALGTEAWRSMQRLISGSRFDGPGGRRDVARTLLPQIQTLSDASTSSFLSSCDSLSISLAGMTDEMGRGYHRRSCHRRFFGSFLATHWRHTAVECRQRVAQGG